MAHRGVEPDKIPGRYETHHEKLMTLYVTRANQEFVINPDLQLCDIELIRSSVELVGEPGAARNEVTGAGCVNTGYAAVYNSDTMSTQEIVATYGTTVNTKYTVNGGSSQYNGTTYSNYIRHTPELNHGWVNVAITNMTQGRQFMQDQRTQGNALSFVLPTDMGLVSARSIQQNGPPQALMLQNVKLEPKIRVNAEYLGSWPSQLRQVRFVEDLADIDPSTYRTATGEVKLFNGADLIMPQNACIAMLLQFKVKPRSVV